jgi:gamma-glutamyltranspeptidase / glutathione hydrolase
MVRGARTWLVAVAAAVLSGCAALDERARDGATLRAGGAATLAAQQMVAAGHPLAAEAGLEVLRAGGSAVDAAVAIQMVLTLVEPQSSGIGGGAFMLHWDGRKVDAYDGREAAPMAATDRLFLQPDGRPMPFYDAVVGGRAVGTPGVLRMLEDAHRRHGRLPWAQLFAPAIRLAESGFPLSARLHRQLAAEKHLTKDPVAAAYFYNADGTAKAAGTLLRNPALAATLRAIAAGGADALYRGEIASDIVRAVGAHANPGAMTAADLAGYQPKRRVALCTEYRRWRVCGMPPPSSGAIAVAQMLGMLQQYDLAAVPPRRVAGDLEPDPQAVHWLSEAARLAFADRGLYVADSDFVPVPTAGLIAADYLRERAQRIGERSIGTALPGQPAGQSAGAPDTSAPRIATSHLSIVDRHGNAVSMTTTIEDAFGARLMVRGFLLNNQLTDFSFVPAADGRPIANRVGPGKRPRSSMAPTLVFERASGQLVASLGSPGGSQIIGYVTKVLVALLDWDLELQQAIALPNFGSRNGPTELESGRFGREAIAALTARGHDVREIEMTSGLQGVVRVRRPGGGLAWAGAADPRREGVALGD